LRLMVPKAMRTGAYDALVHSGLQA
jgi:hypothetical protein